MGIADPLPHYKEAPAEAAVEREELVRRVASSSTFERSPRFGRDSFAAAHPASGAAASVNLFP